MLKILTKIKYFSAKMGLNGGGNADNDGAKGPLSLAIGVNTEALGESSMTLGLFSSATVLRSISIGYGLESIGKYSLVLGNFAIANGDTGIAIGKNSLLSENSEYSIALGLGAYIEKIPKGRTVMIAGDILILLLPENIVGEVKEKLMKHTLVD